MARECDICGKKPVSGNRVSHAKNATRRVWKPNLKKVQTLIGNAKKTVRVCARCMKNESFVKL